MTSAKNRLLLLASLLVPTACVTDAESDALGDPELSVEERGYSMLHWAESVVDVCWENPNSDNAYYRELVRARIRGTWEAVSGVQLRGWDECESSSTGIRITWADDHPHISSRTGTYDNDADTIPMLLNHEFLEWESGGCHQSSRKDDCVEGIAVHEFGHALGLAEEHERPDSTCDEGNGPDATLPDNHVEIGDYDPDSVMNYCGDSVYHQRGELSDGDVEAIRYLYGPKRKRLADFDADGYGELVVGAPGENEAAGAVAVLFGTNDGVSSADELFMQGSDGVYGSAEDGDSFGRALAVGDFDGDGNSDLLVGTPGEALGSKNGAGLVNVLYGDGGGLHSGGDVFTQDSSGIPGVAEAGDAFGYTVASADFNRDGFDDVAVGAPGENSSEGAVVIIYGSSTGLDGEGATLWMQEDLGLGIAEEADDHFGRALATGDFDRDGYDDLAIGAPGEDVGSKSNAGAAIVLYGSSSGIDNDDADYWDQDSTGIKGKVEAGNRFGHALAAGDFDDDGYDDLAIGVPEEDDGAGAVNVIFGSETGLDDYGDQILEQTGPLTGASEDDDHFGASLAAGDFNRDGFDDLVIGVPDEDIDIGLPIGGAGALHVVFGSEGGLDEDEEEFWYQDADIQAAAPEFNDHFGHSLAVNDYNGDSYLDLAVGCPGEDGGSGLVIVLYGEEDGLSTSGEQLWDQDSAGIKGAKEDGDVFGFALR